MKKQIIKSYNTLVWIKIKGYLVRRHNIEIVDEINLKIRTTSGFEFTLTKKEFSDYLKQTNFNEK